MSETRVASISHGKDSIAMLHVVKDILHQPLDKIITVDVWFDDETRAELPPMVEWKDKADKIIYDRWGIPVEHICAMRGGNETTTVDISMANEKKETIKEVRLDSRCSETRGATNSRPKKQTYVNIFYRRYKTSGNIYGFPMRKGNWCTGELKKINFLRKSESGVVQYLGIAFDETKRVERHKNKPNVRLPLVEAEWTEAMCYEWCKENDLLAPTYTTSMRDGCWFCHNQGVGQLRNLYHNYPYLWEKLLALDNDSPITFHADGHTVHDFDRRFKWEDEGYTSKGKTFRWSDLEEPQMNIFQFLTEHKGAEEWTKKKH